MTTPTPSLSERVLCAANYCGLAPVIRRWRAKDSDAFSTHHYQQAMVVFFCFFAALLIFLLFDTAQCIFFVSFPHASQQIIDHWGQSLGFINYLPLLLVLIFAVIWIVPVGFALCGSVRSLPLLKQLCRQSWIIRSASFLNGLMLISTPIFTAFAIHANSLTQTSRDGASVYFLYDEGAGVPRWAFALGMYRISLQADHNWGKGSTVVDRLNRATLRTALANGRVVILATHGEQGYAVTYYASEYLCIGPPDSGTTDDSKNTRFLCVKRYQPDGGWSRWENVSANPNLKLTYVFACNGGDRAAQWNEHLAPAKVVTYNRISTVYDHAYWFALAGPKVLKNLP